MLIGLFLSSILMVLGVFNLSILDRLTAIDKLAIWSITLFLVFYHFKLKHNHQLVAASLSSNNKKAEQSNTSNTPDVTFNDVAGLEEIKEELLEVIDFIKDSEKYKQMGAKIPRGLLFYGPPGTGKTLLAKAFAGESNSTFLYASGSEFVEKYVGVGAKRIRTLFEKAKKEPPSIIFIDEIDAIGSKRNLDNNNEKDQTLNQLLVEMDGFNKNDSIVIIGATNRLDLLDDALLRPGRFDRHIYVGNPNVKSREKIFKVHIKDKPIDKTVQIKSLSQKTHGFSGAQLANIANEAAIIAVRNNKKKIDGNDFDAAIERVVAGLKVKNPSVQLREKRVVAHHEAGHAIVGKVLDIDMIQKISIVPRGQALGYVLKFPDEDRYLLTKEELLNKIKMLLGGRAAELLIFNEITTGAQDDLKKATDIAQNMVCSYGMGQNGHMSIEEQYVKYNIREIQSQIKNIIDSAFQDAFNILKEHQDILIRMANHLIIHETITGKDVDKYFSKNY